MRQIIARAGALALALMLTPGAVLAQTRPQVVGHATTVYNISVGAAWTQVARTTFDDITIGTLSVASGDVISYLKVENTHATQSIRVRFSHNAGAASTDGDIVPAGSFRSWSLYGQGVVEVSLYGSGAATTGVAAATWTRP